MTLKVKVSRHHLAFASLLFLIALTPLAVYLTRSPAPAAASWYDDNFHHRQLVNFTHNSSISDNRRVTFSLDTAELITAGVMQSDCDDVIFTNHQGEALDFELTGTCNDTATTFEVVFPAILSGTNYFYVYYAHATSPSRSQSVSAITELTPSGGDPSITDRSDEEKSPSPNLHLRFDEGHGTTTSDASPFENDGTLNGNTDWQTSNVCYSSKCLYFDGDDDYVTVTNAASIDFNDSLAGSFTIQSWIKVISDGGNDQGEIFEKGNTVIRVTNEGADGLADLEATVDLAATDATITVTDAITIGKWHHVALTYTDDSDDEITLYIDGKAIATSSDGSGAPAADTADLVIGGDASHSFHGFIDEFKIYPYERTSENIKSDTLHSSNLHGTSVNFGIDSANMLSDALIGHWQLNESSGNAADSSGFDTELTNVNTTTFVSGKFGNAADLEASSSQYFTPSQDPISATNQLTLSAWIKPESNTAATQYNIMSKWDVGAEEYLLAQYGDEIRLYINSTLAYGETTAANLATGSWYHIVGVYDGTSQSIKIFINGQEVATTLSGAIPASISNSSGSFHIGAANSATTANGFYDGQIDEVRLYHKAFSTTELTSLFLHAPDPLFTYSFDENQGTSSINNILVNEITGQMTGFTESDWKPGKYGSALDFSGGNKYVTLTSEGATLSQSSFTYTAWIYRTSDSNTNEIIIDNRDGDNDGFAMYIIDVDRVRCDFNDTGVQSSDTIPLNQWVFVACASDGTSLTTYAFGKASSPSNLASTISETTDLRIGATTGTAANFFNGLIDEINIYDYALTNRQLIGLMNGSRTGLVVSPIGSHYAYYRFDTGYGVTAHDSGFDKSHALFLTAPSWTNEGISGNAWLGLGSNRLQRASDNSYSYHQTHNFSFSLWFKSTNATPPPSNEYLVWYASPGYALYVNTSGNAVFGIDDDSSWGPDESITSTENIYDGEWHHLTAVKNGSHSIALYVDGELSASDTSLTASNTANDNNLFIGDNDTSDNGSEIQGTIDELKFYHFDLLPSEIKSDYLQNTTTRLGRLSTDSSGTVSDSSDRSYCVPGDPDTCDAPILHWAMDENQGQTINNIATTAGDSGVLGTLSTVQSSDPTWVPGQIGQALRFDGVDDQARMSADDNDLDFGASDSFTISLWFNRHTAGANQILLEKRTQIGHNRSGYHLGITNTNVLTFVVNDGGGNASDTYTITGATTITEPGWHHVVAVFDRSSETDTTIYLDGVNDEASTTGSLSNIGSLENTRDFVIGSLAGTSMFFDGDLDDLRIYRYARNHKQIIWDFNYGKPVGHWRFDECSGTTAHDSSPSQNHATITIGATGAYDAPGHCLSEDTSEAWFQGSSGKFGSSLAFDGTDDGITIPNDRAFNVVDEITISAWIKTSTTPASIAPFVSKGNLEIVGSTSKYQLLIASTGHVIASYRALGLSLISNTVVTDGNWHHITFTYSISDNERHLYVDGRLEDSNTAATASSLDTSDLDIGFGTYSSNDYYFNGQVDEVKIYNYAFSSNQVLTEFNNGAVYIGP